MEMYDHDDKKIVEEDVAGDVICNNCDTPGARKVSGTAAHNHKTHPCPWCRCLLTDFNQPTGYSFEGTY